MIVWCTVCLFGVPFTFCHGRTRIDGSSSCLYAVPLVYARIVLTLPGFIVIVWCTVCLVGVPFMFCLVLTLIGLIMSVRCTVSVRTRSYLHWWTFLVCVWCTVYVLGLYHVCMVYRWCFFSSFSHCWEFFIFVWRTLCMLSRFKMYCQAFCWLVAASTTELFCLLYLSAVTFSCNY